MHFKFDEDSRLPLKVLILRSLSLQSEAVYFRLSESRAGTRPRNSPFVQLSTLAPRRTTPSPFGLWKQLAIGIELFGGIESSLSWDTVTLQVEFLSESRSSACSRSDFAQPCLNALRPRTAGTCRRHHLVAGALASHTSTNSRLSCDGAPAATISPPLSSTVSERNG